jgi:hypothetical protein
MINILRAVYGGKDVKDIIDNRYIKNNILQIHVNNESFDGDPMVGVLKTLDIEFEYDGKIITYSANEGEHYTYPMHQYKELNTLILTSCNRIDQVLFAIAVNKEIIKEDFNLIVVDCSTPHLDAISAINMHTNDDPYNLIDNYNYNPNWTTIEDYVKDIPKIKEFKIIHVDPRMSKQVGESYLIGLGVSAAAFMGSKYIVKLTGVCNLKYDIFEKFDEYVGKYGVATWKRTGVIHHKSTRAFVAKPDELTIALVKAGFYEWILESNVIEKKFENIINKYIYRCNHMDLQEDDIIVDGGIARTNARDVLMRNLEEHNLIGSSDKWIIKFLDGGVWQ